MIGGVETTQGRRIGRPREFDADEVLDRAMVVFWEQGYDAVSLTDLTRAMGISKTSMYGAFGNKEELFRMVLERYADGPGSYGTRALQEQRSRQVGEAYLAGAVLASTRPDCPRGCLGVMGYLSAGRLGPEARDALHAWRDKQRLGLRDRFRQAVGEGDLPTDCDPDSLAVYLMTVADGIAVQAAGGADRADLQLAVSTAMRNWPSA